MNFDQSPMLVIWEVTQACDLACVHCRASALPERSPKELTTEQGYRLLDEMQTEAHLAAGLDDGTIRRRIQAAIEEIGIPDSAGTEQLQVRRSESPRQIVIETRYSEWVSLPFFNHSFSFHPRAAQPL